MGFNIWRVFQPRDGNVSLKEITCQELMEAGQEFQIRQMCWAVCVNMIANAIGRCEMRTFKNGAEVREREYYMWNVEPNVNQNSTAFWHKLVGKALDANEALIVETRLRDGHSALVVADNWVPGEQFPSRQNEYREVTIGDMTYNKTFYEKDVLHIVVNHIDVKPVIDGMYAAYYRLISAAMKYYEWDHGQHWKVRVDEIAQADPDFKKAFSEMIQQQVKPFFESSGAILPEFNGYTYTNESGEGESDTRDIRAMVDDIFSFTAKTLQIPAVLIDGQVSGAENAVERFLTGCIDPFCDQIEEEVNRKRYGYEGWKAGNYVHMDSSSIQHFDIFGNAANVEKLVGSGAFTINDILRAANMPTINEPWANRHFLTKNIAGIEEAAVSFEA